MAERRPGWWGRRSVRARVTVVAGALFVLVLGLASVALVIAQREIRIDAVDDTLRRYADELVVSVDRGEAVSAVDSAAVVDLVVQITDAQNRVVAASHPAIGEVALAGGADAPRIVTVAELAVDDDRFRLLSRPLADGGTLHVAEAIDEIGEASRTLALSLAIIVPLVTGLLVAAVWVLIGRTLRPVEDIRAEVASISAEELDRRVPVPFADDEVARLARTMNEMLGRLERAHLRQEEFSGDAAHELRSPLARIRAELEVDAALGVDADPLATHRSVLEEVEILEGMVEDLLLLARGGDHESVRVTAVDLDDLVLAGARDRHDRDVVFDVAEVSGAQVSGDRRQLERMVANLLDNAGRHARTRVALALREIDGTVVLRVDDDGPGIPDEDRTRVFERFVRLDPSRASSAGAGLGLAIVHQTVMRHGGEVVIDTGPLGGAGVEVRFPGSGT